MSFHTFCAWIAEQCGFGVDEIRYLVLWSVSIPLAFLMRYALRPRDVGTTVRHLYCLGLGLLFGCLCFGWFVLFHVATVAISYVFLLFLSPRVVPYYMLVYITVIVAVTHIYRMVDDYGVYKLDFSGPIMIFVQKWSTSAFELHDGLARKEEELNEDQRRNQLKEVPSTLQYFAYCFNFLHYLAGPNCSLKEYNRFIDGSNFYHNSANTENKKSEEKGCHTCTVLPFLWPFLQGLVFIVLSIALSGTFTPSKVIDPKNTLLQYVVYFYMGTMVVRIKYYFVFKLEESINNAAGLGFSGYDNRGNPQWNLSKGCDPMAFEFATSPRIGISAWNITTNTWLRRVIYERSKWQPTLLTFVASATWHGFYPSYYLCLVPAALVVEGARKGRRLFRPYFIDKGATVKLFYDVLTWFLTVIVTHPIYLMFVYQDSFLDAVAVLHNFYYFPLLASIFLYLLPTKPRPRESATDTQKEKEKKTN